MAKKQRNRRAARKARSQQRAERAAAQQGTTVEEYKKSQADAKAEQEVAVAKSKEKEKEKPKKSGKPGLFTRMKNYLADVSSEMRRVVWPSREELRNYSVSVLIMLVVFGVAVWLVDTGIAAILVAFSSLRG